MPFTKCISEINDIQLVNTKYLDIGMLLYSLIDYCNNYTKTSANLLQYHKDIPNDNTANSKS